jgi:hypothetical protein
MNGKEQEIAKQSRDTAQGDAGSMSLSMFWV